MNNSCLFSRSPYVVFSVKGNWSLNEVASLNVKKKNYPPLFLPCKTFPPKVKWIEKVMGDMKKLNV